MSEGRLAGQVALVTGAGSGIGRGIAETYAREGAYVAVVDMSESGVAETCAIVGESTRPFVFDVTDVQAMEAAIGAMEKEFGRFDVMVNNAAIVFTEPFLESTLEHWRKTMAIDLEAVYTGSKLGAEAMIRAGNGGRIISTASIQAFMTTSKVAAYNAAKAGVVSLTKAIAVELAEHGILVNAIAPGTIRTGMSKAPDGTDFHDEEPYKDRFIRTGRIPLRRPGLPQDIANAALFLASSDCRYLTGQTLVVDGGLSIVI